MSKLGRTLIKALSEGKSTWEYAKDKPFLKRVLYVMWLSNLSDPILKPYYGIRHFFKKIIRIIQWLPVLWKTEDWDHSYMTTIWAYSLKCLKKGCIDDGHHVVTKGELKSFKTAIAILERISDTNKYTEAHMEAFYKRWGQPDYDFESSYFRNKTEEALSDKQKIQYRKEFKAIMDMEQYLFKQDIDLLCKVLKKYLQRWWD